MQKIVAALALTGAAAFVAPVAPAAGTALNGKEEMVALAESNPDLLGRTIGALPSPTDHGVHAGEAETARRPASPDAGEAATARRPASPAQASGTPST